MRITLFLLGFLCITGSLTAQRVYKLGGNIGMMTYQGDIDDGLLGFKSPNPGVGIQGVYQFHPNIAIRGEVNLGRVSNNDKNAPSGSNSKDRNLSFRSNIFELSFHGVYELFGKATAYRDGSAHYYYFHRPKFTPYLFLGVGLFKMNPQANYQGKWYNLQPLGTEGQYLSAGNNPEPYALYQITFPMGIGVRYRLNDKFDLYYEFGYRKTFTDYLDDVSSYYPDSAMMRREMPREAYGLTYRYSQNNSPDYARIKRGNSTNEDSYVYTRFGITYIFDPKTVPLRYKPKRR